MSDAHYILGRRLFLQRLAGAGAAVSLTGTAQAQNKDKGRLASILPDNGVPYIGITEDGPLYPPGNIEFVNDLTRTRTCGSAAEGQVLYLFGTIMDRKGQALPNAEVEIWQTDHHGRYLHPRGWEQDQLDPNFGYFGKVRTDENGFYWFKTVRPRWYMLFGKMKRAAHIHMKMRHLEHGVLTTEAYFANAAHEEVAPTDKVFLSRPGWVREKIVLEEGSPANFAGLDMEFEADAICCRYDLAFLL